MAEQPPNLFCNLQSGQPTSSTNNPDALGPTCSNSFSMFPRRKKRFTFFRFVKYILILSNAFTGMIGIFIVLFGFAYPEEKFPGDLKGRSCALLSIFYIGWTLIGYCGAHHKKFSFLLIYSALVVLYVFTNIIVFGALAPKFQWLDPNLVWIMCGYFSILMICALLLAYKIRIKEENIQNPYDYNSYYSSSFSAAVPRNSFRRMNSLRSGYSKNWNRLFGANNPTPGTTGLMSTGGEFGPVYTQQQATTIGPMVPAGQSLPPSMQPPLPPPPLNATQVCPPSYQGYGSTMAPPPSPYQMSLASASSMANPAGAYGSNYFTRNWQRMSSKRNGVLRANSSAFNTMNGSRYNTCELKNLGPGRVNFF